MHNEEFDKKLKARVNELPLETPHHLWGSLSAMLPAEEQPKRRGVAWLWLLLLLPATWLVWNSLEGESHSGNETALSQVPGASMQVPETTPHAENSLIPSIVSDEGDGTTTEPDIRNQSGALLRGKKVAGENHTNSPVVKNSGADTPGSTIIGENKNSTPVQPEVEMNDAKLFSNQNRFSLMLYEKSGGANLNAGLPRWPFTDPVGSVDCPPLGGGKPRIRLSLFGEVNAGLFYPFRQTDQSLTHSTADPDSFSTSVKGQVSAMASAMAGLYITRNLTLKSGLQYTRWHEQFSYTNKADQQTITIITIRTVVLPTGDSVFIRDTTTQTVIGSRRLETTNVHQSFDVPIIVGIQFGNRTRFSANVGAIANIRTTFSGYVNDSLGRPLDIGKAENEGVYRRSMGWGLYMGLGIMQPMSERSYLIIEPHARIQLNDATSENAWFRQRWFTGGVQVGWRYIF